MTSQASRGAKTPLKSASAPSVGTVRPDAGAGSSPWVEPHPLKQVDWDPRVFVSDENKRDEHRWALLMKYREGLAKQIEENKALRQARRDEYHDMAKTIAAETLKMHSREIREKEELHQKRLKNRQNLDEQMALLEERAKESRLQDLLEGAETKARSMQLLYEDMENQRKRREDLKKRGDEMREEVARRAVQKSSNKQQERDDMIAKMKNDDLQEEQRQAMKRDRLQAFREKTDAREANYMAMAGRELDLRNSQEAERQDRDEKQHNLRLDLHYSRRDAARKEQQDRVLGEMRMQLGAADDTRELDRLRQEKERNAANHAARSSAELELQKHRNKRTMELQMQAELAQMMMEKQKRDRGELDGPKSRITALCSMAVDQSFVDMTKARAEGRPLKARAAMQRLDAAKDLSKPLGKPRVKPWVDIARSHGPGGVVGVFGGDGRVHQSLMATGGAKRILTKDAARKTWSEGLSMEQMKEGEKAAEQRHLANLLDKSDF